MDKHLRIAIIIAILIPSTSLAYYYAVFLPKNEQAKLEIQKQQSIPITQEKKPEIPSVLPIKAINQPYIAPKASKNTALEIEKCKTKLTEDLTIERIQGISSGIEDAFHYQEKIAKLKQELIQAIDSAFQCINGQTTKEGMQLCSAVVDSINQNIDAYKSQQNNMLKEIVKRERQSNYQECLNSI